MLGTRTRRLVAVAFVALAAGAVSHAAPSSARGIDECRPELGYCVINEGPPGKPIGYGGGCGYVEVHSGGVEVQAHVLPCPGPVIF